MRLSQIVRASTLRVAQDDLPDKWTPKTISVRKVSGTEQVQGHQLQSIAVHEALGVPGQWTITHVPSGMALLPDIGGGDLSRAKKIAEKFLATFPGIGEAVDQNKVLEAVKAAGGPAKLKSFVSNAKRGGPKPPWQSTWKKELRSALLEYDRKLESKGDKNIYRIGHLLEALGKVEEYMQNKGSEATIVDLKASIMENFIVHSIPQLVSLLKKWEVPYTEEEKQEAERKFFRNLNL
jgi:hypothetical protein